MPKPRLVPAVAALSLALLAAACGPGWPDGSTVPAATSPAPTAAASSEGEAIDCTAPAAPTLAQTEGPYYLAGAPEGGDLATDAMPGTRLTLTGFVVDTSCAPLAGARVETWQADASGAYDNAGYTLRGWVRTDADGRFTIHTVVPGEYPGRTEHIHVKLTPERDSTLTTQLYFPGSTANGEDGIYDPSLDLVIAQDGDALTGTYTFVVAP